MLPRFLQTDAADNRLANAVHICNFLLAILFCKKPANLYDLDVIQLRSSATFAALRSPVDDFVSLVFCVSFPSKVFRSYASQMSVAAAVSGLVSVCRRGSVDCFTNYAMSKLCPMFFPETTVSIPDGAKRPKNTFVSSVLNSVVNKFSK